MGAVLTGVVGQIIAAGMMFGGFAWAMWAVDAFRRRPPDWPDRRR